MTRRLIWWAAAAVVVCALGAGALMLGSTLGGRARWAPAPGASGSASAADGPTRLRITAIGVDTPLEDLGLDGNGALKPPADFGKAGWYAGGNKPGDNGPAVIAGHVDTKNGPAIFFRLRELKPGDKVEVARAERWITFKVLAVRRYPKNQFPTDEVYAPTPNPQLRLITCGGTFDHTRRSYVDNVVVYAVIV